MAHLPFAFDARTVDPATELGALPSGEYIVAITDSAMESTKAGDGQFLKLVFSVLDGPHKGAKVFDRLNLINRNQTTVDIAQRALSAICHAVNVLGVQDSQQLHDKPLKIKISYEPAKGEYGEQNRVKAYKPMNESLSTPVRPASPAPTPMPPATQNAYREVRGGASPSEAAKPAGKTAPWRAKPAP